MSNPIWTREKLLVAIQKLHEEGVDLAATSVQKRDAALFSSARSRSHFGSWRAAVEAAGFDYGDFKRARQRWTREKILEDIRELHRAGVDLLDPDFKNAHRSLYLAACAKRYFGSWRRAVEASGLDHAVLRERRVWTKARILRTIRQMGRAGEPLGWAYIEVHQPGIYRAARRKETFGSWAGALREAGFEHQVHLRAHSQPPARLRLEGAAPGASVEAESGEQSETQPPEIKCAARVSRAIL